MLVSVVEKQVKIIFFDDFHDFCQELLISSNDNNIKLGNTWCNMVETVFYESRDRNFKASGGSCRYARYALKLVAIEKK